MVGPGETAVSRYLLAGRKGTGSRVSGDSPAFHLNGKKGECWARECSGWVEGFVDRHTVFFRLRVTSVSVGVCERR